MLKILSQYSADELRQSVEDVGMSSDGVTLSGASADFGSKADVASEFNLILAWIIQATDYGWPQFGELAQRLKALGPAVRNSLSRPRSCRCESCSNAVCEDEGDQNAQLVNRIVRDYVRDFEQLVSDLESVRVRPISWLDAFGRFEQLAKRFPEVRRLVNGS